MYAIWLGNKEEKNLTTSVIVPSWCLALFKAHGAVNRVEVTKSTDAKVPLLTHLYQFR